MGLLDLIFPKRCVACGKLGTYLCTADRRKIAAATPFCPVCLSPAIYGTTHAKCRRPHSLDGLICLFEYKSPTREIIHELKYRFVTDLVAELVRELKKAKPLKEIDFSSYTLVPVPLSASRKNWRGFNQAEILGEQIAKIMRAGFDKDFLRKIKETKPQANLPREDRLRQVRYAYQAVAKDGVTGRDFILADDVWTTGATLKAAAAALKRRGASKVWGLTLATSR